MRREPLKASRTTKSGVGIGDGSGVGISDGAGVDRLSHEKVQVVGWGFRSYMSREKRKPSSRQERTFFNL
jgi:hypothetical protein